MSTSLPLSAWVDHPVASPLGLQAQHEEFGEVTITGWSWSRETSEHALRCAGSRITERYFPAGQLSVSLLSKEMAIRAHGLLCSSFGSIGHLWLHPETSLLNKVQIAEALVAAWTLQKRPDCPHFSGLLRFEENGHISTIGDNGYNRQYTLTVRTVAPPKGATSPHTHEATLSMAVGAHRDPDTIDSFVGASVDELRLRAEAVLGALGYLFLHPDGHIRLAREVPSFAPSVPF